MFRRVELGLQHAFADHGRRTATRPCGTALVTVLVFVGLGFGVFNVKVETDVLKLWVDDSTSLTDVRDDSWTAVSPGVGPTPGVEKNVHSSRTAEARESTESVRPLKHQASARCSARPNPRSRMEANRR